MAYRGFKPIAHRWSQVDQLFDVMNKTFCKGPNSKYFRLCGPCVLSVTSFFLKKQQPFKNLKTILSSQTMQTQAGQRGLPLLSL